MSLKPQAVNFEDKWKNVMPVVLDILVGRNFAKAVWTNSFSDVYALCTSYPNTHALRLYEEVRDLLENHVQDIVKELEMAPAESILGQYYESWDLYSNACDIMNNLFTYLNMQCMKKRSMNFNAEKVNDGYIEDFLEINDLGLCTWSNSLLNKMKYKLTSLLLAEINRNRMGEATLNQVILQTVISSLIEVEKYKEYGQHQLYEATLEEPYLEQVREFYKQKSLELVDNYSVQEYVSKCLQLLDEEGLRAKKFVTISYDKVMSEVRQMLVLNHLDFINTNCKAVVESQNGEALSDAYLLLNFSNKAMSKLVEEYQDYVERVCKDVFKGLKFENAPVTLCESLVGIHEQQRDSIKRVFLSNSSFITALDKGFNNVVNKLSKDVAIPERKNCASAVKFSPVPDLLVKYCDQLLKKGTKGLNENDLDDKLTGAITIFKYLEDKDLFNKIFSKMLARRLIFSLSQSMDAEESMIKKLKQVCGHEYTNKIQKMLTDVKISDGLTTKFLEPFGSEVVASLGLGFNILVMQTGAWPLSVPQSVFLIPQELERSLQKFEKFYKENFNGRKLVWNHALSSCEVKFNHLNRSYTMQTSVYIMSILVVFNNTDNASFADLANTGVGHEDLLKYLQLLVESGILLCSDGSKLNTESRFSLNFQYQNKRQKFKLMLQVRETPQEVEKTLNTVTEDRKMFLQAVIVRTMKARKRMHHKALIMEVAKQSVKFFVANNNLVKKTIEQLIDRQYLERVGDSIDEYSYIA